MFQSYQTLCTNIQQNTWLAWPQNRIENRFVAACNRFLITAQCGIHPISLFRCSLKCCMWCAIKDAEGVPDPWLRVAVAMGAGALSVGSQTPGLVGTAVRSHETWHVGIMLNVKTQCRHNGRRTSERWVDDEHDIFQTKNGLASRRKTQTASIRRERKHCESYNEL